MNYSTISKRLLRLWMLAAIACGVSIFTSCSSDDNVPPPANNQTETLIIYDTDIGSSTDDLFALELLHRYQDEGRCRLLGVIVDRVGEEYASCTDVVNTYFGHAYVPVGLVRQGITNPPIWIDYKALPTYTDGNGQPMFRRSISDYSSLPDGWQLYRRLLAAQPVPAASAARPKPPDKPPQPSLLHTASKSPGPACSAHPSDRAPPTNIC